MTSYFRLAKRQTLGKQPPTAQNVLEHSMNDTAMSLYKMLSHDIDYFQNILEQLTQQH